MEPRGLQHWMDQTGWNFGFLSACLLVLLLPWQHDNSPNKKGNETPNFGFVSLSPYESFCGICVFSCGRCCYHCWSLSSAWLGESAFQKVKGNIKLDHELAQGSAVVLSHSGAEPGAGLLGSTTWPSPLQHSWRFCMRKGSHLCGLERARHFSPVGTDWCFKASECKRKRL